MVQNVQLYMCKYFVAICTVILLGKKNLCVCLCKVNEWAPSVSKAKPATSDGQFYSDSGEEEKDEEEGSDSSSEDSSSSSEGWFSVCVF